MKKYLAFLLENNTLFLWFYRVFVSLFFRFCGLFVKSKKNLILFLSMSGDSFGGSPRVLYEAADILIADYSSCMFDFLLTGKPVVCYVPDCDQYVKEGGLTFDEKNKISHCSLFDEDSLVSMIRNLSCDPGKEKFAHVLQTYIQRGSDASDSILNKMVQGGIFPSLNKESSSGGKLGVIV